MIRNQSHSVDSPPPGRQLLRFGLVLLQVGLLWWLIGRYAVEDNLGVIQLMPVLFFGFLIHSLLPQKLRIHFFVLLGIAGAFALLNAWQALTLLGLATLLFGICNLPLAVRYRALLLIAAGGLLAWLWGWQKGSIPDDYLIVPIVGSLFMFRASVYLYDQQFEKERPSLSHQIAYFLMLPNLALLLFPIVDYKIFKQTYYADEPLAIYQKGIRWMVRGFFHLMLYRIIYYYFLPSFQEVNDFWSFIKFAVTNYLLILRMSGLFHFGVGALCLFGWNLPRAFNNYFLASGFSDLWRRINIYWRDYIMKLCYYPVYFRLRKMGKTTGMVLSVWIVFFVTWLLHSHQWFWLKGSFPLRAVDAIFWGTFGVLISISAVVQQRFSKKRARVGRIRGRLTHMIRILGMFVFMCLLWSFWISPTAGDWLELLSKTSTADASDWLKLLGIMAGLIVVGSVLYELLTKKKVQEVLEPAPGGWGSVFWSFCTLLPFVLFFNTDVQQALDGFTNKPIAHLMDNRLNVQDQEQLYKGYYENLMMDNKVSSSLWETVKSKPESWKKLHATGAVEPAPGWLQKKLKSNYEVIFKDALLTTNEYGMRDKPYPQEKCAGCLRFALLGTSIEMGSGVKNNETYENVLEDLFNKKNPWPYCKKVEILNFAISGTHLPNFIAMANERILPFKPDVLIYTAHPNEARRSARKFAQLYVGGSTGKYQEVNEIIDTIGLAPELSLSDIEKRFWTVETELLEWGLKHIAASCTANNILPVWAYIPVIMDAPIPNESAMLGEIAKKAGFITIDLHDLYDTYDLSDLMVAPWDRHPSPFGHQLIAKALYESLIEQINPAKLYWRNPKIDQ